MFGSGWRAVALRTIRATDGAAGANTAPNQAPTEQESALWPPFDVAFAAPFNPARLEATRELLLRWHGGDAAAMAELVEQERALVEEQVRRRLGAHLRRSVDTQDIIQETLLHALRSAPRFLLSDRNQLRTLLARMVENRLCSAAAWQQRQKRDLRRELPGEDTSDSGILDLDRPAEITDPGDAAGRDDLRSWVRLALELLDAEDREVLVLRDYQELSFEQIAAQTGESADALRMRHRRALPKLARALARLREGRLEDLL